MSWTCERCGRVNDDDLKDCPDCAANNKPYYRKNLDKPDKLRDQFTLELDPQERAILERLKARWDFKSDSKVLKICLENAMLSNSLTLSERTWRYFMSKERQRLSSFQKLPQLDPEENAMQN